MLAKQCDVTVYKGMQTKISKTVFEHEVKILEAIMVMARLKNIVGANL